MIYNPTARFNMIWLNNTLSILNDRINALEASETFQPIDFEKEVEYLEALQSSPEVKEIEVSGVKVDQEMISLAFESYTDLHNTMTLIRRYNAGEIA